MTIWMDRAGVRRAGDPPHWMDPVGVRRAGDAPNRKRVA
jgi:hypothetical protein